MRGPSPTACPLGPKTLSRRPMTRIQADLLLLVAAVIWGLAFFFQKAAMDHVGPFLFVAARSGLAAIALAPLAFREIRRHDGIETAGLRRAAMAGGAFFFIAAALQQAGIITATVTNAGFLTGLYVVFTPLLVWMVRGAPPGPVVWIAVLLAFVGTWALGGGTIGGFSWGDTLIAISALFWAVHLIVTGNATRYEAPITFTCVQFAVVMILALAVATLTEPIRPEALWRAAASIAFVGLMSSALTFTMLAIAMRHTPAAEAAVLVSTETVFAALAGALLLNERLAPIGWAGAGLILLAMLLVQLATHAEGIIRRRQFRLRPSATQPIPTNPLDQQGDVP